MAKKVVYSFCCKVFFLTLCLFSVYCYDVNEAISSSGIIAFDGTNYVKIGSYNKNISLIVGTDYRENNENPSRFSYSPEADARELLKVLKENYEFDQIYTLFGESATKDSILNAIDKIVDSASYNDSVFVFMGGYGVTDFKLRKEVPYLNSTSEIASDLACVNRDSISEYPYFVPFDGSFKEFGKNISVEEIENLFLKLKSKHLYLIFDAPLKFTIPSSMPVESLIYDADYLRKVFNHPGRNILIPSSSSSNMLVTQTGSYKSPFANEIINILSLEKDFLSASEISKRVYYSTSSVNIDSDFFLPGGEIFKYGEGDFFFTVKPEKRVLALSKEIGALTNLVESIIQLQKKGTQMKESEITASEILNWDLLSQGLSSGNHTLDKIVYEYIDKKTELLLKRGAPFSESEKETILNVLNRFVKDNSHYTEALLNEFGLSVEEKSLDAKKQTLPENHLYLTKTLLQRLYPNVFADTRNDYINKIQELEKEKSFIENVITSGEPEKDNIKLLSERNDRKKNIEAEIKKEACIEGRKAIPTYKAAFFCIQKLNELIALEKEVLLEEKSREIDELNAGTRVPLMVVNRPKSFSETYEEYWFRKDIIGPLLISGLENKLKYTEHLFDTRLSENESIKSLEDALSLFTDRKYVIGKNELNPSFLTYYKKKGRGEVISAVEEPELLMLPDQFELEITDSEWEYINDHKKDMLWRIGFTFNDKSHPKLVESYIEDQVSGKKFNLYPPFTFIKGGCYKKRWEENFSQENSPIYCVDSFYIGRYEVTKEEFMNFTGVKNVPIDKLDHPATHATWEMAKTYCNSLGVRYGGVFRLPSRAEWEYVASLSGEKFPYVTGSLEFSREKFNIRGKEGYDEWDWTSPVGSFASNGLGIFDLAGNVDEWVLDWDGNEPLEGIVQNYKGPSNGKGKIVIGGSWASDGTDLLFSTKRSFDPELRNGTVGFRCVRENESERKE